MDKVDLYKDNHSHQQIALLAIKNLGRFCLVDLSLLL